MMISTVITNLHSEQYNSIIEKMVVMTRTAIEEKASLKWCFGTFLSFLN
jgi:hypothetical protein